MPIIRTTISDTLSILRHNLAQGLQALQPGPSDPDDTLVVVGNIALWNETTVTPVPEVAGRLVITLVKTEEEYALKNQATHRRNPVSNNLEMVNPPVFLNLYLLLTANFNDYEVALTMLSRVIGYFQWQRVFTETNAALPTGNGFFPVRNFHFNLSMVSPSLEQLNHLWGVAGGRMLPSALYKLQLLQIEYVPDEIRPGNPITEIVLNEQIF